MDPLTLDPKAAVENFEAAGWRDRLRVGGWVQMPSGIAFWPCDPRADEVRIGDIGHSLALLCRFGGHCKKFYSVAEHSVHVARHVRAAWKVPPETALWGLLHDAAEAYVCDLPRPLKKMLPEYSAVEDKVLAAIAEHFGLPKDIPAEVWAADDAVLVAEAQQIMAVPPMPWEERGFPANISVEGWPPDRAVGEFLAEFQTLQEAMRSAA